MAKSPQRFVVELPGEIVEIAQDDDISWLTLFYALPKELAEKYPDSLKSPRCPYEVLYEGSYGAVAKSDMLNAGLGLLFLGGMAILRGERPQGQLPGDSQKLLPLCSLDSSHIFVAAVFSCRKGEIP